MQIVVQGNKGLVRDPEEEKAKLAKLAIQGFAKLMEGQQTEDHQGDLIAVVDGLLLAYLAIGTMLGAKRELMVKNLRPDA
jgi:hypothetical protein